MEFFFNELSIHNQFLSQGDFKAAVGQFRSCREDITAAGFRFYLHRNLLNRPALGTSFRKGVQRCFTSQQVRALMNWFSKDGYFLPDEACTEMEDCFTCYFKGDEGIENRDVSDSGLAECAFRKLNDSAACSVSLEASEYNWTPVTVVLEGYGETDMVNYFTNHLLATCLDDLQSSISSWSVLLDRIEQLPEVSVASYVLDRLNANPFSENIANGLYVCARALSEMATAVSLDEFNELFAKYCTGGKARFSDSSNDEKERFKSDLTFDVDGEKTLCPYHGKVKIQQYRLHLAERPVFERSARVVYVGPKLTKV